MKKRSCRICNEVKPLTEFRPTFSKPKVKSRICLGCPAEPNFKDIPVLTSIPDVDLERTHAERNLRARLYSFSKRNVIYCVVCTYSKCRCKVDQTAIEIRNYIIELAKELEDKTIK